MKTDPQNLPERPLVTFILVAYNHAAYIREAIAGAFAQSYGPMEIILSDDCSTDRTFEIMQDTVRGYDGDKNVVVRQNEKNLGLIEHLNTLFDLSRGELIILAAGDDISLPNRTALTVACYLQKKDRRILLHGDAIDIDLHGKPLGRRSPPWKTARTLHDLALSTSLYIGATGAVSKSLINDYPPIRYPSAYEDLVWGFRAALSNAAHYLPEPLVQYRVAVGMSGTGRPPGSFSSELRHLYRSRRVSRDVFCQRLSDLRSRADADIALCHKIEQRIKIEAMCVKIHERRVTLSEALTMTFALSLARVISNIIRIAWSSLLRPFRLVSR
jgi:glycosyltransferase involved in cell wall biosynthesis